MDSIRNERGRTILSLLVALALLVAALPLPRDALAASRYLPQGWQSLQTDYVEQTPQEVDGWHVLLRRPAQGP